MTRAELIADIAKDGYYTIGQLNVTDTPELEKIWDAIYNPENWEG
jgi:hypothetical protein